MHLLATCAPVPLVAEADWGSGCTLHPPSSQAWREAPPPPLPPPPLQASVPAMASKVDVLRKRLDEPFDPYAE